MPENRNGTHYGKGIISYTEKPQTQTQNYKHKSKYQKGKLIYLALLGQGTLIYFQCSRTQALCSNDLTTMATKKFTEEHTGLQPELIYM